MFVLLMTAIMLLLFLLEDLRVGCFSCFCRLNTGGTWADLFVFSITEEGHLGYGLNVFFQA